MGIERVPCTECMGKGYNMVPRVIQGENNRLITIDVREDCIHGRLVRNRPERRADLDGDAT